MQSLGNQLAKGAVWMILLKFSERGLGLISTLILVRLLAPADFGLVAMATAVVAGLELINAFGFEIVLVQKRNVQDVHYNTAWTFRLLFATLAAVMLVSLSIPAASFYEEPRLVTIILVLALGTFVGGFANIGTVQFQKELNFPKEFILRLTVKLVSFSIAVPLAFYLRSYWALLGGMVSMRVALVVMSYVMHSYRPRFSIEAWRELFSFSIWLFIGNLLFFLRLRSADFIIGKMTGSTQLGLYSVSYELADLPTTEFVMPVNRAAFPAYSKVANDQPQLRKHYLDVNGLVALFAFPAGLGFGAIAELMVPVLLGEKWLETVELIKVLVLNGTLIAIQVNISSIYLALGRPNLSVLVSGVYVALSLPMLIYFTNIHGAIGAAWVYLATSLIVAPLNYFLLLRLLRLKLGTFLASMWRPLASSAVMYYLVTSFVDYFGTSDNLAVNLWGLIVGVVIGVSIFSVTDALLWWICGRPDGAEQRVLTVLESRIANLSRRVKMLRAGKQPK